MRPAFTPRRRFRPGVAVYLALLALLGALLWQEHQMRAIRAALAAVRPTAAPNAQLTINLPPGVHLPVQITITAPPTGLQRMTVPVHHQPDHPVLPTWDDRLVRRKE